MNDKLEAAAATAERRIQAGETKYDPFKKDADKDVVVQKDSRTQPPLVKADEKPWTFADLPQVPGLKLYNLECELYREYDFGGRVYRITDPVGFYQREGGTTHRVVDRKGMTHCVPTVGHNGCALRWVNRGNTPVEF